MLSRRLMRRLMMLLAVLALFGVAAGCGDDDTGTDDAGGDLTGDSETTGDGSGDGETTGDDGTDAESTGDDGSDGDAAGGGGEGSLTLAGEEIALGAGRCFLEEQEAAAGGGSIEATAQASGTNAAGDPVSIDFSRFSEESQFAGDDVSITLGDPTSPDSSSLTGNQPIGTVSIDGGVVSATDFTVIDDEVTEQTISFTITC